MNRYDSVPIELREYVRDPDTHAAATTATAVRALDVQTTRYTYDAAGQLIAMTNPAGDDWQYAYDLVGQRVSATDPDGGTTTTGYTPLGQVRQRTNANGDTLAYTYDPLGRVTTLRDESTTGTVRASWTYDQSDLTGSGTALGQLTAATRFVDGVEYTTGYPEYDAAYRPVRVDTSLAADSALLDLAGDTFSTRYEYAADGQVAQVTYPQVTDDDGTLVLGQETVTTRFDDRSMPAWMSGGFGWGTYVADARWEFDGKPRAQDLGNTYGAAVTYLWDAVTRELSNVSLNRERVDGAEVDVAYTYDAAGNVTSVIDAPTHPTGAGQGDAQCFRYDGLRRLQTAWTDADADCGRAAVTSAVVGGVAEYWSEFAYDGLGNRTAKTDRVGSVATVTEYTHGAGSAGPHQLTAMTETTDGVSVSTGFTWDAAGNQTSRTVDGDVQTLEWDPEGELVGVTGAGGDVANVFTADGTRLVRVDDDGVTVFLPGGQEVRSDGAGVSATRWYTFAGSTVATRTGVGMGAVASVVTDAHGTPVAHVHNKNWAAPVNRVRTDPFGQARAGQVGTLAGRGFLSAPADPTGLTLLGARFYDPHTGTFVSVDPLLDPMLPAQFNAYVYSGNNPLTWADPTGEAWQMDPGNPRANSINTGLATVVASQRQKNPTPAGNAQVVASFRSSAAAGAGLISSGTSKLAAIPARNPLVVTPGEFERDLRAQIGAYSELNVGHFLLTEQGGLVHGWLKGSLPTDIAFGAASSITRGLQQSPTAIKFRATVSQALRSGAPIPDGSYVAGKPGLGNPNFVRDMAAIVNWEAASNVDRSLAVVGTFDLRASVVAQVSGNSAVVQFVATNSTTLGSGIAPTDEWRTLLNSLPGSTGPMSEVWQSYTWAETVTW